MINTIFYFPEPGTFDELSYLGKSESESGVSARTIVFDAANKAIYKGGVKYTGGSSDSTDGSSSGNNSGNQDIIWNWNGLYSAATGNRIGTLTIGGTSSSIYVPRGTSGEPGTGGGDILTPEEKQALEDAIDRLDDAIEDLNQTANDESDRLDGVIKNLNSTIETRVENLIKDANWILQNWTQGLITYTSNFGQSIEDLTEGYLQRIGVWDQGDTPNATNTRWSKIQQQVNSIDSEVNALYTNGVDTTALQSRIEQTIQEQIAQIDISTMYARKEAEELIEWLYSGLSSETSPDKTFNELTSAGKNGMRSAIADIRTNVEKLKNGDYVAEANFDAKVDGAIAGLKASASSNYAKTEIFNKIARNSDDIAGIVLAITNDSSSTTIANKIASWKAGLVTHAYVDGATANLIANSAAGAAQVMAYVNAQGSSITLDADKINLNGQTSFLNAIGNSITVNTATAASTVQCGTEGNYGVSIYNDAGTGPQIRGGIVQSNGFTDGQSFTLTSGSSIIEPMLTLGPAITHDTHGDHWLNLSSTGLNMQYRDGSNGIATPILIYYTYDTSTGTETSVARIGGATGVHIDGTDSYVSANKFIASNIVESGEVRVGPSGAGHVGIIPSQLAVYDSSNAAVITLSGTNGTISATGGVSQGSDITKKDVIADTTITVDQIADAPSIQFTWKTDANKTPHVGTSAQYWQTVMPEVITEKNDTVFMDYSSAALVSAITIAKEVVSLKEEIAQLKQQIAELKGNNNE